MTKSDYLRHSGVDRVVKDFSGLDRTQLIDLWREGSRSELRGLMRSYRDRFRFRGGIDRVEAERLMSMGVGGRLSHGDLSLLLSLLSGYPYAIVRDIVSDYFELLKRSADEGFVVTIKGFGRFDVKEFSITPRRTPIGVVTGRVRRMRFKQSKRLRDLLNGRG